MPAEAGTGAAETGTESVVVEADIEPGFVAEVAEAGTEAGYVAAVVAVATQRGIIDPEQLSRIRLEARDTWESYLNTYSGRPIGNLIDDRSH
jgi:hypothetical protein